MSNLSISALRVQFKASLRRWYDIDEWKDQLRRATDNSSGAESISRETLVVFCESIDRLNDGLGLAKNLADLIGDHNSDSLTDNIAGRIHEVFYLISDLSDKFDWLFRGEIVVSHGVSHARSWSEIVLMNCRMISFWIENNAIITKEHLNGISYDSRLVEEQLGIEFERVLKLWDQRHATQDNGLKLPMTVDRRPGSDDAGGGQVSLRKCDLKAGSQYKSALEANPELATDRAAYDWYVEHLVDEGERLPNFATWVKYVRNCRKASGEQKNQRGVGHETRSVVSGAKIEQLKRTKLD